MTACNYSMVFQDVVLFDDTIAQNIRMWDQSVEDFAIRIACDDAQLHSDIVKRPQGYATKVVRGGQNFSGGQCQRAAIARALAVKPKLLICDEATSSLDVTIQEEIVALLNDLRWKKGTDLSILFICHDIALVQQFCNRVLVLYKGKIVEHGIPDEIICNPKDPYTKRLIDSIL